MNRLPSLEPHATQCSNPHRDDYWTCPGCYTDLGNVGEGDHVCPTCDRPIRCTVEMEPACHCSLIEAEEEETGQ